MPVLELACLRLSSSTKLDTVKEGLLHGKLAMESFTGTSFYYLQSSSFKDQRHIFVVGEWPSLSSHWGDFIPGEANKEAMGMLSGKMDVNWLRHFNLSLKDIEPILHKRVVSISRWTVHNADLESFETTFERTQPLLEYYCKEINAATPVCAWQCPGDKNDKEGCVDFVMLGGWDRDGDWAVFTKTEDWQEWSEAYHFSTDYFGSTTRMMDLENYGRHGFIGRSRVKNLFR